MKNFPIKVNDDIIIDNENMKGKTFWVSRSCAVAVFVFADIYGEWYIAANKRGSGCPDFVGYWNCPCGYVDYGETTKQAAKREFFEEMGFAPENLKFINYNDNPSDNKQNITFRFAEVLTRYALPSLDSGYSEPDEVEEVKWIPLKDIGKYTWAFGHDKLIFELFKDL